MSAASMGAAADHDPLGMERRSKMVYPNPTPSACGTFAAETRAPALLADEETND